MFLLGKKSYKDIDIYYIGCLITKYYDDNDDVDSIICSYHIFHEVDGYIEESNGNKYLVFASTDKSKKVLTKYTELSSQINNLIETINDKPGHYKKRFLKIKLDLDDDLSLNKIFKNHNLIIAVRSVFQEEKKYYPQFFDRCLYNL